MLSLVIGDEEGMMCTSSALGDNPRSTGSSAIRAARLLPERRCRAALDASTDSLPSPPRAAMDFPGR